MAGKWDFKKLFIFEMANNHAGDVRHGLEIIRQAYEVSKAQPLLAGAGFTFAFKLQYRDIGTFIHPEYKGRKDIKYVKRFLEARLSETDFKLLVD